MLLDNRPREPHVTGRHWRQRIDAAFDLAQQVGARRFADADGKKVIKLGQNERREKPRRGGAHETRGRLRVPVLARVERREQTAGVEQDHAPKPAASSSSTRSARLESPLSKSGTFGGG